MTQEEKELLLKDLCARLPYGIICDIYNVHCTIKEKLVFSGIVRFIDDTICVKPYLRPMSSMTEEEIKEYKHLVAFSGSPNGAANFTDWLNTHHFDYRGLIPLGLANDASGLNIY